MAANVKIHQKYVYNLFLKIDNKKFQILTYRVFKITNLREMSRYKSYKIFS